MRFSEEEFAKVKLMLSSYGWALNTLMTKLKIVHADLRDFRDVDAIDYIASRVKAPESIAKKLHKLGLPITAQSARENLFDIAGARIICHFNKDIYMLAEIIKAMPDIAVINEKDYVSNPKLSGYRSYHLLVTVPVFFGGQTQNVTCEVQIRTEAMNFWATLEHKVRYKYQGDIPKHLSDELAIIADKIDELDKRMFTIHDIISFINS